jgi:hypothetical protein
MTAYAMVRKSHLPCDSADAQDWVASRVLRLISGTDPQFKTAIGVIAYEVVPNGYQNEIRYLPVNYEWAAVAIDVDVNVSTSSEDGCYDTCATGDIPLPDFEPCTPCLTEVAVDGITIVGNGTPSDPLIAIGGGGGGGALIALPFTTDHLSATGNAYAIGNIVWYNGNVYRCIAANDSILPTNTSYWVNLGAGFPTVQQPSDWNATSGNNQILNKPTIPAAQVNSDWNASSGVAEILNKPSLAAVATSGDYADLINTPSIPPAQVNSDWNATSGIAEILNKPTLTNGTVTSVAATVPNVTNPAFSVNVANPTNTPSVDITANGVVSQYIRGDGSLANFPLGGGGGASVNYYLNGSISQGTIGGNAYFQMSRVPVLGAGTNFTRTNAQGNGYIAQFITDAGDPNLLAIPSGNWNFETYFNASSGGGSPSFYMELYKYDGATFTLISTGSTNPEAITGGTVVDLYVSALAVPSTVLAATDRLAVRIFVTTSGRNITLHTEDNNLCQVITTFTTGLNALNGLTAQVQNFATGTSGTDFGISSASSTHTFNLPTASASNRGALSTADWTAFNGKFNTPSGTTAQYVRGDGSLATMPSGFVRNEYIASSAASIDVPIPVGYSHHKIFMVDITAGTANSELWHRVGIGSPSVIQSGAGNYSHYRILSGSSTALASTGSAADTKMVLLGAAMPTGSSGQAFNGNYTFYNPDSTTLKKQVNGNISTIFNSGLFVGGTIHGLYNATDAVTSLRFQCSAGNISGKIIIESYL